MTYLQQLADKIARVSKDTDEVNILTTEGWPAIVHVKSGPTLMIYVESQQLNQLGLLDLVHTIVV